MAGGKVRISFTTSIKIVLAASFIGLVLSITMEQKELIIMSIINTVISVYLFITYR